MFRVKLVRILGALVVMSLFFAIGQYFAKGVFAQHVDAIPAIGAPAYNGKCPVMIRHVYNAIYYMRVIENDGSLLNNPKAYINSRVREEVTLANSYAQTCPDVDAIATLYIAQANIEIDKPYFKVESFTEACAVAIELRDDVDQLGYFKRHKLERFILQNRIDRCQIRQKVHHEN